jgi:3',5'-cyclic-AMP phosphodiesterase
MLIVQISDTHISQPNSREPHTLERISVLRSFVKHVSDMEEVPDLILHTGDVSQNGKPEEYEIVKSIMRDSNIPVFFALGNRDFDVNLAEGLKCLGGARLVNGFLIYSIEGYPVRLIAMDTQKRNDRVGTTCSVRLGVLEKMLKEQPDMPTAIFMHHPAFQVPTSKYPFQFSDTTAADALLHLVERNEQIVQLFCGHMHRQFNVQLKTCNATIAPSLSSDNREGDYEPGLTKRPLFLTHRWKPNQRRFESQLVPVWCSI